MLDSPGGMSMPASKNTVLTIFNSWGIGVMTGVYVSGGISGVR